MDVTVGDDRSLRRLRVATVGLAMLAVALAAGSVFDRTSWSLSIAAAAPAAVAIYTTPRRLAVRAFGALFAVAGSVTLVVVAEGGGTAAVADAWVPGVQALLSTEWPSPLRPDLVGAVAAVVAVATAVSAELAGRRRFHVLPAAPVLATHIGLTSLAAPAGARLVWLLPIGACLALLAALHPGTGLRDRWTLLRGERRIVPLIVVATLLAGASSVPVALADRADPRRTQAPSSTASLLDPIESTLALRSLEPAVELHLIEARDGEVVPGRWRTAALDGYDGQRWTPAISVRPIGRRLGPDAAGARTFDVRFLDGNLRFVPLPGRPIAVDAPVETDVERTVVLLSERADPDEPIEVVAEVVPASAGLVDQGLATRPVDESISGLTPFAADMGGDGSVLEQVRRLETTLRDEYVLDSDAPGGGQQRFLLERFLRDTRRGTTEQFVTGFVLLVRSLGVDARVATGFVADAAPGALVLESADALVWPEVRTTAGDWVPFDPVPEQETSDAAPPPEQPATQTPAAAQPPIAPPPDAGVDQVSDRPDADVDAERRWSAVVRWIARVSIGIGILLLPVLLAISTVLAAKAVRRRRRLRVTDHAARVVGTWAVATDRLVDAGLDIPSSATDGEIAAAGHPLVPAARRELDRLAALSSAVVFGAPPRADQLADVASTCLGQIETSMAIDRTRVQRWRWRLSLRSLRPATRSPIGPGPRRSR